MEAFTVLGANNEAALLQFRNHHNALSLLEQVLRNALIGCLSHVHQNAGGLCQALGRANRRVSAAGEHR